MRTDDLVGAGLVAGDGKANPADRRSWRAAPGSAVRIAEQTRVTGLVKQGRRVAAVETDQGTIRCQDAGDRGRRYWSRAVGRMCGVTIPLIRVEHMYIVTERIAGVTPDLPVMRDPDGYIYFKEEVAGLVMGGFEPKAKPWGME